ncbi:MAG: preprotein translocase subunit SecY [Candidatus Nanoarchaeia archaeon]|nr:preprotein translocase subunit SecY [Candidatus Nanoarchaeia archaeon]
MSLIQKLSKYIPDVAGPSKKLGFNQKLKWTGIVLLLYYVLLHIPLYGLGQNALSQFKSLSTILGASFGSLISLGIGPIVTASIVLQLLAGSGILKIDLTKTEGRAAFQSMQKVFILLFVVFEAIVYVMMGGLAPAAGLASGAYGFMQLMLIIQLIVGGYMIVLMDGVVQKWGFGSGVSLFIAAGVSREIFIAAFSPFPSPLNPDVPVGRIPYLVQALGTGDVTGAMAAIVAIVATVGVFALSVYGQSMKVEIPLSFGRIRGHGIRWPLKFMYTSNIPVILIAALMANIQLWGRLLESWGRPLLGTFQDGIAASGLVKWVDSPSIVLSLINKTMTGEMVMQALVYSFLLIIGSAFFSVLWVKTANMSAESQAKQILSSGMQIPGFRRDPRVLESILNRYIPGLTVMGGALVGLLAAFADLLGALSRGTGILLAVMIVYKLYEDISREHAMDLHPALRKMMGGDK